MHSKEMEEIYAAYSRDVYHFLLHLCGNEELAEDILQDTFLKAIENIDSFDGRCKLTSWLCQIAKNLYFDYLRKQKSRPEGELTEDAPDTSDPFVEQLIRKETGRELMSIVHSLPEPYKEVFLLRVYGEMSFQEIAALFGKSEVWGRVTFLRSKERIMKQYRVDEEGGV